MKRILLTAGFMMLGMTSMFAQKYMTRTGKISFDATAPKSPEDITAVNNEVACVTDAGTGEIVFQVLVKSFKFKRALMQDHFNENYMESDKYPKAEFKGMITNIKSIDLSKDGTYNTTVTGKLTIHGVTQDVSVPGTITVKGGTAMLNARFNVKMKDYQIKVPDMVSDKVGKEAAITVDCSVARK